MTDGNSKAFGSGDYLLYRHDNFLQNPSIRLPVSSRLIPLNGGP